MAREIKGTREFIVEVLWIHGRSVGDIAKVVNWSPGQVRGHTNREFAKPARADMSDDLRAELLRVMKATRVDEGRLRDEHFLPIQIASRPAAKREPLDEMKAEWVAGLIAAEAIEDSERRAATVTAVNQEFRQKLGDPKLKGSVNLKTKDGRRDARQFEGEVQRMVKAEQKKRDQRIEGLAQQRGGRGSALEYLLTQRYLRDGVDLSGDKLKTSEEQRRLEAGMRLRKYIEGSRIGGLGAMDYERATMGSGSGPSLSASAHKLQCINCIGAIRQLMSNRDYATLEAVVDQDIFIWNRAAPGSRTRSSILRALRLYLDVVAVHERLMTREEFEALWDEPLPAVEQKGYKDAAALSNAAADFLEAAR